MIATTPRTDTSAGGSMYRSGLNASFLAVLSLTTLPAPATASTYEFPRFIERTAAGPTGQIECEPKVSTAEAIMEIRRRSGLTWEELGDLFDVSRRSVHHWANGKPVSAKHDQTIHRMLAVFRHLDRGNQFDTRAVLLTVDQTTGVSTLDLLKDGRFNEARSRVADVRTPEIHRTPLSRAALDTRRPKAPAFYLGAEQERPDIPPRARRGHPKRTPKTMG